MLALCSMLQPTYYAQNFAGIIRTGLYIERGSHYNRGVVGKSKARQAVRVCYHGE